VFETYTVHQMAINPKPLEVEKHEVSNSENTDFKTGMLELYGIKINKTIQFIIVLIFFFLYMQTFLAKYCFHSQC